MKNPKILEADELLVSLNLLSLAVQQGAQVKIQGSPTASIVALIGDLLSLSASQLRRHRRWQGLANPGLKFVEQISLTEGEYLQRRTLNVGFSKSYHFDGVWYDPVGNKPQGHKDQDDLYYQNVFDPLGNSLQVEIPYNDLLVSLNERDRAKIAQCLEDIEVFLVQLSKGLVDWRFMRHLRSFLQNLGRDKSQTSEKRSHHYHYRQRRKAGGTPQKNSN